MIKNQHSVKVLMRCVEVFVKTGKLVEVKRQVGINEVPRLVFKGLRYLDSKYGLSLDKDRTSSIGYILTPSVKGRVLEATAKEIIENDQELDVAEPEPLKDSVKEKALQVISELHKERIQLKKCFDKVDAKIRELEILIKGNE